MRRENGFTLLEMLLVLSIISLLTMIILPLGNKWIRSITEEEALQSFIATVYSMQAYSMANYVPTRIVFKDNGKTYITSQFGKEEFGRYEFPGEMKIAATSRMKTIEFHPNGNIVNSGTLSINTSIGITEIRFQFLRGRMIVYD